MNNLILEKEKFPADIGGGLDNNLCWDVKGSLGKWSVAFANNRRLSKAESERFRKKLEELTGLNWEHDSISKFVFHCDFKGENTMAKKKQGDVIHTSQEPHRVKCVLTTDEKAEAANQLASSYMELESLAIEKKTAMADFKSRRELIEEKIHTLSRKVKEGLELRQVKCELQLNYTKLRAKLMRLDTKEIVEERDMTEDEKQMEMFEEDKKDS